MKKFYKSNTDKRIAGVCGGLGEYTDIDPFWYRLLFIVGGLYTGIFPAIFIYVIICIMSEYDE
jgi:phage shock protein C